MVNFTLQSTTNEMISISTSQTFRSWVVIFNLRQPMEFYLSTYTILPGLLLVWNVLYWGPGDFPVSYSNRDTSRNAWNRHSGSFMVDMGDLIQQYEVSLSRMLNDILTLDQQWLSNQSDFPPISWPWYRAWPSPIMSGFHGAFATGVACQQGTLTTPDTWFRPLCRSLRVLWLLRPVSPTLHRFNDLPKLTFTELRGFHRAFATGVACQQGALTLPDTWFRPPFWDLLMLQLLRPNSSNLPCLYSTFHLEYPLVLYRFCLCLKS